MIAARTVFYREGAAVPAAQIREEVLAGAADAGVPQDMAAALLAGALAGDPGDCVMLEELIPGLECITETAFGEAGQ